jgi:glyoxylase-like metal-dependent hydrolase (beta-lactamase superfamily II)
VQIRGQLVLFGDFAPLYGVGVEALRSDQVLEEILVMLDIITIPVTDFQQNCRILADTASRHAVVVDPGGDTPTILNELSKRNLTCKEIWLTHSHLDHCGGVAPLIRVTGAPLSGHPIETMMRSSVVKITQMYGLPSGSLENCPEPDRMLSGGETISFGDSSFSVLFTPGHSPGSICFYNARDKYIISGDVLFAGSVGRTDLPGGSSKTLIQSIAKELLSLPDSVAVLSGHGPDTTIGRERLTNPFLSGVFNG